MHFRHLPLHSKFVWERFVTAIKIDRIPYSMLTVRLWRIGRSTCPQCLDGGVSLIQSFCLSADVSIIQMHYEWQAGVRCSFPIRLAVFLARGSACMKLLHFVGWVEPTPCFVGFRCTLPNLHFAGIIAKCETQQRSNSEPSRKSFFYRSKWPPPMAGGWAETLNPEL
jgi:hypothetical protein